MGDRGQGSSEARELPFGSKTTKYLFMFDVDTLTWTTSSTIQYRTTPRRRLVWFSVLTGNTSYICFLKVTREDDFPCFLATTDIMYLYQCSTAFIPIPICCCWVRFCCSFSPFIRPHASLSWNIIRYVRYCIVRKSRMTRRDA